jgi:very-short-patch-repair endonuclease/predicted transcriptional regulator of viral defense system
VAALAHRQHGVVSMPQLRALGLERGAIEWRLGGGRLHRVHRGVYAVGHRRLAVRGRMWAAVLACGGVHAAALSHRTAAAVWDLNPLPAGRLDVTSLRRSTSTGTLRVHRGDTLNPLNDVVRQPDGLPVTTVARTLADLAQVLTPHQLERACHRAEVLRQLDAAAIEEMLKRLPGRPSRSLRRALASLAAADPDTTRSELEERFLALVADAELPRPRVNATVAGHEVDFLWRASRVIAETDGAAAHLTPTAFDEDRSRDAELQIAGFRVVRFTWRQVTRYPDGVAETLEARSRAARRFAAPRGRTPTTRARRWSRRSRPARGPAGTRRRRRSSSVPRDR